jgi:hypothetical protein
MTEKLGIYLIIVIVKYLTYFGGQIIKLEK